MITKSDCGIVVFAKAPQPGKVKTRLIPLLGAEGASALQHRLLVYTLDTAGIAAIGPIELWGSPGNSNTILQDIAALANASLFDQGDGNLGERMTRAFRAVLARMPRCLLIGSDCPSLTAQDLKTAAIALHRHRVVLGPAEDGGYFLIGLQRSFEAHLEHLFENIAWGTQTVLESTRQRLREVDSNWHELAARWDVDQPEDYWRLCREMPALAGIDCKNHSRDEQ